MRIAWCRADGGFAPPARALLRLAGAVAGLLFFLGYLPILLNDRRRAMHDWAARTVVINQPPDDAPHQRTDHEPEHQ